MKTQMNTRMKTILASTAVLALTTAGCNQASPSDPDQGTGTGKGTGKDAGVDGGERPLLPLLPWKTGNTWTYRVTDVDQSVSEKVTTIGAEELVGGDGPHRDDEGFKVVTKKGAMDQTISWQVDMDGTVVRLREQSFGAKTGELQLEEYWEPYKLHVDGSEEHRQTGASWLDEYDETKIPTGQAATTMAARDRWTVTAERASVTVPAGTFDAVVLQKAGGTTLKTYWYVPGVGKVKESGAQTEELVEYQVAP